MPEINRAFGTRLRELREAAGMTLRAVARELDVSAPFVSDVEHGRRMPGGDLFARWVDIVGGDRDELRALDARWVPDRVTVLEERVAKLDERLRALEHFREGYGKAVR